MGLTRDGDPTTERLFAVVVPDQELLRERRIANAGDLLRFEIEGQSVHLPTHKRVLGYDLWFEPLPRTTTGKLKRHEIERRVRRQQHEAHRRRERARKHDWGNDTHAAVAAQVIAGRAKGAFVVPDANLELDLALDSMERVELIAELEQRFGVAVSHERAHDVLTVGQLIEAVRPAQERPVAVGAEESWAVLLRDLPAVSDPVLSPILAQRTLAPALFFGVLRLGRLFMPRIVVSGIDRLPSRGPYIISPNHQSYLDPFFMCSVLPYHLFKQLFFVGAAEYFESPITAWLARQFNLVPVDPDANLVPAMKAGAFGLTHGKVLVLFPEGERSIDGTVKRFKKGASILARHVGVPIVPVAIHGVFDVWPRNRPFNWRLLLPGHGHCVRIAFGEPMPVSADESYADNATALRARVVSLWESLSQSPQRRRKHECDGGDGRQENA